MRCTSCGLGPRASVGLRAWDETDRWRERYRLLRITGGAAVPTELRILRR